MADNNGITGLAIQYAVAIVVGSAVIGVLIHISIRMEREHEINIAIKEAKKIANIAEIMYVAGDEGSVQKIKTKFPKGIREVVYGSKNKDLSNRYYILTEWNDKRIFYSNVSFCGNGKEYAIIDSNCREVILSLVIKEGKRYVEIMGR